MRHECYNDRGYNHNRNYNYVNYTCYRIRPERCTSKLDLLVTKRLISSRVKFGLDTSGNVDVLTTCYLHQNGESNTDYPTVYFSATDNSRYDRLYRFAVKMHGTTDCSSTSTCYSV